ncbi:MAG: 5'-3' exonuclease H3TH domain-containing protein [Patescibacteria group bacterium]
MKTLLLIDANSIVHRSFHALPPLTTKGGKPAGALYGLSSILLKLSREDKPDYAVALFDRPEPTFRDKKYAEYKAQRPPTPDGLVSQLTEAHNLFNKFGVKTFEYPGFEADDLIATLAERFKKISDLRVVILTGDTDTLQLVDGDKVIVRIFKKGISETMTYNKSVIEERYGLLPEQLVDYKALVGDPSDNIKGVPGIGPKTASDILKEFGSIEKAYSIPPDNNPLLKKLQGFRKEAELSKELVRLDANAPLDEIDIKSLEFGFNKESLSEYFGKLGFESLVKRFTGTGVVEKEDNKRTQGKIF